MGLFVDTVGTTTPLAGFDETRITYLAATNVGWLPYLADEGIKFVHYPANRVRRQFGLDQDIPDDISFLMESPTSFVLFCGILPLNSGGSILVQLLFLVH